jgi:hypothetical protein
VLTTVFGTSADDRERQRILRENTKRLEDLARVNKGLLESTAPGGKLLSIKEALAEAAAGPGGLNANIGKALLARGLTFEDLAQVHDTTGLERGPEGGFMLQELLKFLEQMTGTVFGTGFGGERERLRRGFEATDATDAEKFQGLSAALTQFGGQGIGALFQGDVLGNLRKLITEGTPDEILQLAGGIGSADFLDTIQDLIDLLSGDSAAGAVAVTPSGDFASVGPGTVAGIADTWKSDMLAAAMGSMDHLAHLDELFTRVFPEPAAGEFRAGGITFGEVNIVLGGGATREDGIAVADAFVERINERLGLQADTDLLNAGIATLS